MNKKSLGIGIVLLSICIGMLPAQMTLSGELKGEGGLYLDGSYEFQDPALTFRLSPEFVSDGFTARVEADFRAAWSGVNLNDADATNDVLTATSFSLGEAYVTANLFEGFSVTAGRRIISWGTALTSNPVGYVNPVVFEEKLTSDRRADWLIPVPLLSAKYILGPVSAEAVYIPFFVPNTIPGSGSRFYPEELKTLDTQIATLDGADVPGMPPGVRYDAGITRSSPDFDLKSWQAAGRVGFSLGVLDAGIEGWYGFAKSPVVEGSVDATDVGTTGKVLINFTQDYRRQGAVGIDLSATVLGSSVVWLESSLALPGFFTELDDNDMPRVVEKNAIDAAFGMDRTMGLGTEADLYFAAEGTLSRILEYEDTLREDETGLGASLIGELRSASQDLTLRVVLFEPDFLTLEDTNQYMVRASVTAKPSDGLALTLGSVLFGGSSGDVGRYDDNDFLYAVVRASF